METLIQYLAENFWILWAILSVVCLILEMSSGDFYITCFAIGAASAAIADGLGLNGYWQLLVFAACSAVSIFYLRPFALKFLHTDTPSRNSNADAIVGRTGTVSEDIPANGYGRVALDGDDWKAQTADGTPIAKGQRVRITDRDSIIITVAPL